MCFLFIPFLNILSHLLTENSMIIRLYLHCIPGLKVCSVWTRIDHKKQSIRWMQCIKYSKKYNNSLACPAFADIPPLKQKQNHYPKSKRLSVWENAYLKSKVITRQKTYNINPCIHSLLNFDKDAKIYIIKQITSSEKKMVLRKPDIYMQKNETKPLSLTVCKNQLEMNQKF